MLKFLLVIFCCFLSICYGSLFAQKNEIRHFDNLDGLWTFVREPFDSNGIGIQNQWYKKDLSAFKNATVMPVPCAYNELSAEKELREHLGWVWYQTSFYQSKFDHHLINVLKFESVQYYSRIYLNGEFIGENIGGHLPFEFEIEPFSHRLNILTVAVNNTLSHETLPHAEYKHYKTFDYEGISFEPNFDFFNYAGILRSVKILKLPSIYITDITLFADAKGNIEYSIELNTRPMPEFEIEISVYKKGETNSHSIWNGTGIIGKASVDPKKIVLWWPRGYGDASLYVFEIKLNNVPKGKTIDIYRETFGFRTVSLTENNILINGKIFYCIGFGMHEDFDLFGRGFNQVVMTKDLNMLEWMNGNCYRTSHYPYSEERAYEADRRGIVVIAETPAVGLEFFHKNILKLHQKMLLDLFKRDHRHPSIVMWSLANEPRTSEGISREYFNALINQIHALDRSRPATIVFSVSQFAEKVADLVDLICLNRYYGWYINLGDTESINGSLVGDIMGWRKKFGKPMILSEYGADTIEGFSAEPSVSFSVQYQVELLSKTHEAIDFLRKSGNLAGEMIWNFADFMTDQTLTRVIGNHKGVLTRNRQPKMAAYLLKYRYEKLSPPQL
jgi:beta-glucuronidase